MRKRDGQPTGVTGVISADEQRDALGIDKTKPKPAPAPLTPAQERRRMSGDWIGEDLNAPDFEHSVISGPDAIANALGLRVSDFDRPLGSMREGEQHSIANRPKIEEPPKDPWRPGRSQPSPEPPQLEAAANELRSEARQHIETSMSRIREAQSSGDPARIERAKREAQATLDFGREMQERIGL